MTQGAANAGVVRSMYDPMASDYDELWAPLLRRYGLRLLDGLELGAANRVLDLGCGVGRLLPDIEERAPRAQVVGVDLTEGMLKIAPGRFGRAVMDATKPCLRDSSFDAVVSSFMLFHCPEPAQALSGVLGSLRPGGRFAVAVWGPPPSFKALEEFNAALDSLGLPPDPTADGPPDGEEQVNSVEKMTGLLGKCGFVGSEVRSVPWEQAWDVDSFIDWRSRMGPGRRRLEQLEPAAREDAVHNLRERIASLTADDLVHHDEVVLAWAHSPG